MGLINGGDFMIMTGAKTGFKQVFPWKKLWK